MLRLIVGASTRAMTSLWSAEARPGLPARSRWPGPAAGEHLDLPVGDKELQETANPITECDCMRSYGRS
jgi:hypothetical protein